MCLALWANAHPYSAYFEEVSLNDIFYPDGEDDGIEIGELIESPELSIEEAYARRQVAMRLPTFINTLGPKLRKVFELHFTDELRQQHIAKKLGMSVSAVSHAIAKIERKAHAYFRGTLN